jgi:hypothetical protein
MCQITEELQNFFDIKNLSTFGGGGGNVYQSKGSHTNI